MKDQRQIGGMCGKELEMWNTKWVEFVNKW